MPGATGNIVTCILDGRTDQNGMPEIDIESSNILRGAMLARWTQGILFPASFNIQRLTTDEIRLGNADSRFDVAIVEHGSDFPTICHMTERERITPARGTQTLIYRVGIVLYDYTDNRFANIWWDTETHDLPPTNGTGWLRLATLTVPTSGNITWLRTAPIAQPNRINY